MGYTTYSDNVCRQFAKEAVKAGMDIFRVFDRSPPSPATTTILYHPIYTGSWQTCGNSWEPGSFPSRL